MPIQIKYIQDGIGVEFICFDTVTGQDIIKANKDIYSNKNFSKHRYQLIDRTECTSFQVSNEEIKTIAEQDVSAAKINPNVVVALISTTELQYGLSRMYHTYVGDNGFLIEIFRDRTSAEEWIESQLKEPDHNT